MRLLMFIAAILCLNTVEAQRLYSEVGDIYEKSKRAVVDNAKTWGFLWIKNFAKDSTKLNDYTKAQTVLMISDKLLVVWWLQPVGLWFHQRLLGSKQTECPQRPGTRWMDGGYWEVDLFLCYLDRPDQATNYCTGLWYIAELRIYLSDSPHGMAVNTGRYTHSEPSLQKSYLHILRTDFMWPGTQSLFRFLTDLICLADCPVWLWRFMTPNVTGYLPTTVLARCRNTPPCTSIRSNTSRIW